MSNFSCKIKPIEVPENHYQVTFCNDETSSVFFLSLDDLIALRERIDLSIFVQKVQNEL